MLGVSGRYLTVLFLRRLALIVLGFGAMLLLFDALNNADTIEKRYGDGFAVVPRYMLFKTPEVIVLITPFATLLAALLTLLALARQNEVTAFKAAGMSFYRMLLLLLPATALVALTHFAIADQLSPWAKKRLARYEIDRSEDDASARNAEKGVWLRDPVYIVNVVAVQREGRTLSGVTLMRRDAQSNIVERIVAKSARFQRGQWRLENVVTHTIDPRGPSSTRQPEWIWKTT
ncbi:MAG: LptF/LptG family permease, partial [Rhodospirillales bacterium]|nr:LptF/LptG family permease [Rhodospirillales bacterium]